MLLPLHVKRRTFWKQQVLSCIIIIKNPKTRYNAYKVSFVFDKSVRASSLKQKMSRHPEVKWAQRADKVYVTIQLPDSKNAKVNLTPDGVLTFSATAGAEDHLYELQLPLFDKVNVEESKINVGVRGIFCVVQKAEDEWWKRLLKAEGKPPHYVKVDWDKWVDEDEDEDAGLGDLDLGGMDFSQFEGDDAVGADFDDGDDEVQEASEPEKQEGNDNEGGSTVGDQAGKSTVQEAASST